MKLLTITFASPEEFLAAQSSKSELSWSTRAELEVDENVLLEVSFPEMPSRAHMRATVAAVDGDAVRFNIHSDDQTTAQFMMKVARGQVAVEQGRRNSRFPATLPVKCRIDGYASGGLRFETTTEDLSAGGAFIRSQDTRPEIGTRVRLVIGPISDGDSYVVYGEVAWLRRRGERRGFGVRFTASPSFAELRSMLRRSVERGRLAFAA